MKDILIIGGGPGGYVAAIRARQLGMSVLLVEKDRAGGTCLNRGCIPTKAYYRNALFMHDLKTSRELNVELGRVSFDMTGAWRRKNQIVDSLVGGVDKLLQANRVERENGAAALLDRNTVLVNGAEHKGRNILLATGSVPATPMIPGIELPGVVNSDQMLELKQVPPRLAIIGGGVIGLEFACIFNALGSRVTVFECRPELLSGLDKELGRRLQVFLKKQGIGVHTAVAVEKIEAAGGALQLNVAAPRGDLEVPADIVLAAGGRQAFTAGLGLEKMGIEKDQNGFIKVDQDFGTTVKGIYAVGDVIGGHMLAHVASEEARAAVEKIAGLEGAVHYHAVPACVFTIPEIASVGLSEEAARAQGLAYRSGKFQLAANGKALTMGAAGGMVKVLADQDEVVIGVHIIGPHASDLIMEGTLLVQHRMKVSQVAGTIHPHPTLSEALQEALQDVKGRSLHLAPARKQVPTRRGADE
ncbi:MAG: dihydrolipoyl dehydrogenase [Syntrophomonadaceae bacterium]|nr:dihydrolipoyl dehydrogenase [Syntrophomonadaceae bacterium]